MYENIVDHVIFDVYNVYRLRSLMYENIKDHILFVVYDVYRSSVLMYDNMADRSCLLFIMYIGLVF